MRILTTIQEMRLACRQARHNAGADSSLALVPTMGAIHQGHLSLVEAAREECDVVAASIFVNPLQFGPTEDFARYPRTFDDDCAKFSAAGVDLLFAPAPEEMYPAGATTFVEVAKLSERLDGASRPGHFRGVATVVNKLFHIVSPDVAFFGQKDASQVAVLQAMVRDLNLPIRIAVCPIVREADGLAMSSRNRYLSPEQRTQALALCRALRHVEERIHQGETSAAILRAAAAEELSREPALRLDYIEIVDPNTLEPATSVVAGTLIALAAWVGETRLIDNLRVALAP
ncbi:pantoate--beta-alanine ligase [Edaphobacter flagellatus]|uniref:pantoate--beta-alanine ligase n=1 Tax=Edaphobacter flagellatus TaxID=1933044 RepID=UPI0021B17560|nr:pantoate--beta-alanine ligase [Edaphobacter flagellatus]